MDLGAGEANPMSQMERGCSGLRDIGRLGWVGLGEVWFRIGYARHVSSGQVGLDFSDQIPWPFLFTPSNLIAAAKADCGM